MSSHTPGPWASNVLTVCGVPANFTVTAVDSSSMEPICFAPTFSPRKYTEIAANARLIAAAPELLAELTLVVDALGKGELPPIEWITRSRDIIAKVKAAK